MSPFKGMPLGCSHLSSLVLGNLVLGVLPAVSGLAVRPAGFGNVDLVREKYQSQFLEYVTVKTASSCSSENSSDHP